MCRKIYNRIIKIMYRMQYVRGFFIVSFVVFVLGCSSSSKHQTDGIVVQNLSEYRLATDSMEPGTTIILANGRWKDAELLFEGHGTKSQPIRLRAQTKGEVLLEGKSSLSLAGEYLEVSGLVFRNGFSPKHEVISFKKDNGHLANYCRVTNCLIDGYNNPERFEQDIWVVLYGKQNRFDHNTLQGKNNQGVTLAVRLNQEDSRENNHQIDHNYFGYRPVLGSNGGESLRIGTSRYSGTYSNTLVEDNYFEHCNGEVEIISNKSCGNTFRNNVFYECKGTLTLRHGNENRVKNNYFVGNYLDNCGGIRVINEKQFINHNYLYGLSGYRFRGALVIMNGVPQSPQNRYGQVIDATIKNNIFINCSHIELCAGSDKERSAVPVNTFMANNIFYSDSGSVLFYVHDDISGITFLENIVNAGVPVPSPQGFEEIDFIPAGNNVGLYVPPHRVLKKSGFAEIAFPVRKEQTGASFGQKLSGARNFHTGKNTKVAPGLNTLSDAIESSSPGDILLLNSQGKYLLTKECAIHHPLTIMSDSGKLPVVLSENTCFFRIENGGALEMIKLVIDGSMCADRAGNCAISTSHCSMVNNYKLIVRGCQVQNLNVNKKFDFLTISKGTFADTILLEYTSMKNISGSILSLDKEVEELGIYNAEYILIYHCRFDSVGDVAVNVYRGGTDESTAGPVVKITDTGFEHCGIGPGNKFMASVRLHGVQRTFMERCSFDSCEPVRFELTNGEPVTRIMDCRFIKTGKIQANTSDYFSKNIYYEN
jgi:poly(beta-D-mannuronate) lyase